MSGPVRITAVLAGIFVSMLPLAAVMADSDGGKSGSNPDGAGFDKPATGEAVAAGGGTQGPAYFDGNNGCGQDRKQDVAPDHQGGYDDNNGNCGGGQQGGGGNGNAFGAQAGAQAGVNVSAQGNAQSNPDAAGLDTPEAASQGPAFFDSNNGCGQDKKLDIAADHQGGFDDNNGLCGFQQLSAQQKSEARAEAKVQLSAVAGFGAVGPPAAKQQAQAAAAQQAQEAAAAQQAQEAAAALPVSGGPPESAGIPLLALIIGGFALALSAGGAVLVRSFVSTK